MFKTLNNRGVHFSLKNQTKRFLKNRYAVSSLSSHNDQKSKTGYVVL